MKNVLITGATGMIGSLVLENSIRSNQVGQVTILTRKPVAQKSKKITEVLVEDFSDLSSHEEAFNNIDIVYFCIGVYTGAVSNDKFREITLGYTKEFGKVLKNQSPSARFCFLSGAGADRTEKSRTAFAKFKGMAENYLIDNFTHIHSFRPSYIYPVERRKEPNSMYVVSRKLYPVLKIIGKNFSIKSTELAKVIFKVGLQGTEKKVLENSDILDILN